MKLVFKIPAISLFIVALSVLSLALFDHWDTSVPTHVVNSIFILLGVVSIYIFLREPTNRSKAIFLNFGVYFLSAIASFIYPFIGKTILASDIFSNFYFDQYILRGLVVFLLSFSLLYVVFDSIFSEFTVVKKYLATFVIVGGVFGYYYHPYFEDPKYLYKTEDIADFRTIDKTVADLREQGINPTAEAVGSTVTLNAWRDGKPVGLLFEKENLDRISFILPYLEGNNYTMLLMRPLYTNVIFMDVLCIVFIIAFFGYQYKKDPPQGAYIEKILFLFLPFCSLDILHYFAYVRLQDYGLYRDLFNISQYLIVFNAFLLFIFFSLRLSFITSIKGEFYERELVLDSEHISRWRDGIDNLVVRHFLNPQTIHGRLFAPREAKSKS